MLKQQKIYLLFITVLVVWGIIGYQFYSKLHPKSEEILNVPHSKFVPNQVTIEPQDTIQARYRDPFLGTLYSAKKIPPKKKANKQSKLPFPTIVYNGMVKGDLHTSYILTINGKQEVFKTGQSIRDIILISADQKQALIRFQKINKTLLRQ